jgi:hypothetical protein
MMKKANEKQHYFFYQQFESINENVGIDLDKY